MHGINLSRNRAQADAQPSTKSDPEVDAIEPSTKTDAETEFKLNSKSDHQ